jgi:histone H3/H4
MGLINKSKIRSYTEFSVADEVEIELEKKVEEMIKKAESRAQANNRRTILARDL